jgi:hypothetical protein
MDLIGRDVTREILRLSILSAYKFDSDRDKTFCALRCVCRVWRDAMDEFFPSFIEDDLVPCHEITKLEYRKNTKEYRVKLKKVAFFRVVIKQKIEAAVYLSEKYSRSKKGK